MVSPVSGREVSRSASSRLPGCRFLIPDRPRPRRWSRHRCCSYCEPISASTPTCLATRSLCVPREIGTGHLVRSSRDRRPLRVDHRPRRHADRPRRRPRRDRHPRGERRLSAGADEHEVRAVRGSRGCLARSVALRPRPVPAKSHRPVDASGRRRTRSSASPARPGDPPDRRRLASDRVAPIDDGMIERPRDGRRAPTRRSR